MSKRYHILVNIGKEKKVDRFKTRTSLVPEKSNEKALRKQQSSLNVQENHPLSAYPSYWADIMNSNGPLWVVEVGAPYHAVVLAGINGNGTPEGTNVHIMNPWPPNSGADQVKTFINFDTEFGLGAGAGANIVHG